MIKNQRLTRDTGTRADATVFLPVTVTGTCTGTTHKATLLQQDGLTMHEPWDGWSVSLQSYHPSRHLSMKGQPWEEETQTGMAV